MDFQFTAAETARICSLLEAAGLPFIELGHGAGLGASEAGWGLAAETDEAYTKAAAETLQRAHWGMFSLPGVATPEQIARAANQGMKFLRVGITWGQTDAAEPLLREASNQGLLVFANFLKSHQVPAEDLALQADKALDFGADILYVVDSAGGMLPQEVAAYVKAIKKRHPSHPVGFHGHDNLGLGVANALAAVQAGASYVDACLQGIGRSGGNASTEQLLCVLRRSGYQISADLGRLLSLDEAQIPQRLDALQILSGLARVHSQHLPQILEQAEAAGLAPQQFLLAFAEEAELARSGEEVAQAARRLAERLR